VIDDGGGVQAGISDGTVTRAASPPSRFIASRRSIIACSLADDRACTSAHIECTRSYDAAGLHVASSPGTMPSRTAFGRDFGTLGLAAWSAAAFTLGSALSGCANEPEQYGVTESASTVADYSSSGCSTAVVIGLSRQIALEAGCENPASFVSFSGAPGITLTSNAVLPFLVKDARDDLQKVAASNSLQINSALRSIAQQYLLYRWYQQGRCGITAAATVGHSNHEGGRAVDLANYSSRVSAMSARGWAHDVPGDAVHFDHTASPDNRGQDTKAFQVLWNRNHPTDTIAADGVYGPQTEARLKKSPATGFAIGPSCVSNQAVVATAVSMSGPDQVPPQTRAHYTIVVQNSGETDWPATTSLALASGDSSPLHDTSWLSATEITTLGTVPAGGQATIDLDVMTPAVTDVTPITQPLALVDDTGATLGTLDLVLTVAPNANPNNSGDGTEPDPTGGTAPDDGTPTPPAATVDESAGCSAAGGTGWLALVLPALVLRRRRR
jgi:Synergist-CTERM protein sorting domain-containing protein